MMWCKRREIRKKPTGSFSFQSTLSVRLFFILAFVFSLTTSGQTTYVVTSTADNKDIDLADQFCADITGNCTLRAAIQNSNKSAAKDRIHFNIKGTAPHIISPQDLLPPIVAPLILDATTQPGYLSTSPKIVLSGEKTNMPVSRRNQRIEKRIKCLQLSPGSSGSTIRGFAIGGFGVSNYDPVTKTGDLSWGYGILIETENNKIQGNFIGIRPDGKTPFPNHSGITDVSRGSNLIGGREPKDRNIISANLTMGILTSFNTVIEGNLLGTDVTGELGLGNEVGIALIRYARNNQIRNNLISGNEIAVDFSGEDNLLFENRIGTNYKGSKAIGNDVGILLRNSANNVIGNRNLISGNGIGIKMFNSREPNPQGNMVYGNLIGTDIEGSAAIPNATGILIISGSDNVIGGSTPEQGNVISGNTKAGIELVVANSNRLENNFIGATSRGNTSLPNGVGIVFGKQGEEEVSTSNVIINNLIGGNNKDGILLKAAAYTTLAGNRIGLQKDATSPLPNGGNGVRISASAIANCIGGTENYDANLIGFNHGYGVKFEDADHPRSFYVSQLFVNLFYNNCEGKVYPLNALPDEVSSKLLVEH